MLYPFLLNTSLHPSPIYQLPLAAIEAILFWECCIPHTAAKTKNITANNSQASSILFPIQPIPSKLFSWTKPQLSPLLWGQQCRSMWAQRGSQMCALRHHREPRPRHTHFYKAATSFSWNSDEHINQEAKGVNTTEVAPAQRIHEERGMLWKQSDQQPRFPRGYPHNKNPERNKLNKSQRIYF